MFPMIIKNPYIQILNLFYLCEENLTKARRKIKELKSTIPICLTEKNNFHFILYSWGGPNDGINEYKERFIGNMYSENHIWYDYKKKETKDCIPNITDSVKHIQGLTHENVIPNITKLINRIY